MASYPWYLIVFFAVMYLTLIFGIINPEPFLKFSLKFQNFFLKIMGVKADIEITPKSIKFVRFWYILGLIILTYILFFVR